MTGIKSDLDVTLMPIGNNIYRASYTADTNGVYLLNVMWADRFAVVVFQLFSCFLLKTNVLLIFRQVKGCPLKVTVSSTVDASKVICSGDGLKWGIIGKEIKSFIDARKSGPGIFYFKTSIFWNGVINYHICR